MELLVNILIFAVSVGIVWYFAGILVDSAHDISKRYCRSGFITAFFLLGPLTSISEISVAINSAVRGVPEVSVGNLVGASFVILLFIVPVLALAGRGVYVSRALTTRNLALLLGAILLPVLLVMDGNVTRTEGLLAVLAYATAGYALYRQKEDIYACEIQAEPNVMARARRFMADIGRILIGAVAIFAAAHFLVEQAVYFADVLSVPPSLVGLILLSLGTNIPEIVIAIRSVLSKRADIALGDYLGSAAMNTLIFGLLAIGTGVFGVEAGEFVITGILMAIGLICFFFMARSGRVLSRREGIALLAFYVAFIALQILVIARLAEV